MFGRRHWRKVLGTGFVIATLAVAVHLKTGASFSGMYNMSQFRDFLADVSDGKQYSNGQDISAEFLHFVSSQSNGTVESWARSNLRNVLSSSRESSEQDREIRNLMNRFKAVELDVYSERFSAGVGRSREIRLFLHTNDDGEEGVLALLFPHSI